MLVDGVQKIIYQLFPGLPFEDFFAGPSQEDPDPFIKAILFSELMPKGIECGVQQGQVNCNIGKFTGRASEYLPGSHGLKEHTKKNLLFGKPDCNRSGIESIDKTIG